MTPDTANIPDTRAAFDAAMAAVRADHATLRRLAANASKRGFNADDAISLADAMTRHESDEARLFALPFVTRQPQSVAATAARARRRCIEYTSGDFHLPTANVAAALFVEALLTHLAVEDAWLKQESEQHTERLHASIA